MSSFCILFDSPEFLVVGSAATSPSLAYVCNGLWVQMSVCMGGGFCQFAAFGVEWQFVGPKPVLTKHIRLRHHKW